MTAPIVDVPRVLVIVAEMAYNEVGPLNAHPGCWYREIGADWRLVLNGHATPEPYTMPGGGQATCAPFTVVAFWRDWPALMVDPAGGIVAGDAAGDRDMEAELLAALATVEGDGRGPRAGT